jgi:hypothetical protein
LTVVSEIVNDKFSLMKTKLTKNDIYIINSYDGFLDHASSVESYEFDK